MRPRHRPLPAALCLAAAPLLGALAVAAGERPASGPQAVTVLAVPYSVRYADGLLTVKADNVALDDLLDAIARHTGLVIVRYVQPREPVFAEFQALTVAQALQRLLRRRSYVTVCAASAAERAQPPAACPNTVWILPQGEERAAAGDARPDMPAGPSRDHPDARAEALDQLDTMNDADAIPQLTAALADDSALVREAAVVALAERKGSEALQGLGLALNDADPRVREQAIDALVEIGGEQAASLVEQALEDGVPFVRQAAAKALDELRR